jgi:hypothetical protein
MKVVLLNLKRKSREIDVCKKKSFTGLFSLESSGAGFSMSSKIKNAL